MCRTRYPEGRVCTLNDHQFQLKCGLLVVRPCLAQPRRQEMMSCGPIWGTGRRTRAKPKDGRSKRERPSLARCYRFPPVTSDGIHFVECDECGHGRSIRSWEVLIPREWAISEGWVTDVDGRDYCPECAAKGSAE
jgi:hypothetical protein